MFLGFIPTHGMDPDLTGSISQVLLLHPFRHCCKACDQHSGPAAALTGASILIDQCLW